MAYDINSLINAAKSGNTEDIFKKLNPSDAAKIKSLLNDEAATKRLLNSEKAQKIIGQLMKDGGKNG